MSYNAAVVTATVQGKLQELSCFLAPASDQRNFNLTTHRTFLIVRVRWLAHLHAVIGYNGAPGLSLAYHGSSMPWRRTIYSLP